MHYLPYVALAFLFLFNVSESRSAPKLGFLSRGDGDGGDLQNESTRNAEVWNEVLSPGILIPDRTSDDSFENSKFTSSENDRESSMTNSVAGGRSFPKDLTNDEQQSRRNHLELANFATLLSNPETDFGSNGENGVPNDRVTLGGDGRQNDLLWAALDQRYQGSGGRNMYPRFKAGHTLFPQLTEKMDSSSSSTFPLIKRSPDCLRKCMKQAHLHPAQCHSLC